MAQSFVLAFPGFSGTFDCHPHRKMRAQSPRSAPGPTIYLKVKVWSVAASRLMAQAGRMVGGVSMDTRVRSHGRRGLCP